MFLQVPPRLNWLPPWRSLTDSGEVFIGELRKELGPRHVLFDVSVKAIALGGAGDDVLFATDNPVHRLAVVHLTWAGRTESDAACPCTALYEDWRDWIERAMIPDNLNHLRTAEGGTLDP